MGESADKKKRDLLFVQGKTKNDRYKVVRAREDKIEVGEMSDLKDGEEIRGEVVKLKQRSEHPQLFDVETVVPPDEGSRHDGPAQVATDAYRKNFDAIFASKKRKKTEFLN